MLSTQPTASSSSIESAQTTVDHKKPSTINSGEDFLKAMEQIQLKNMQHNVMVADVAAQHDRQKNEALEHIKSIRNTGQVGEAATR